MDKSVIENFREKVTAAIEQSGKIYFMPSFSIGIYGCTDTAISIDQALAEADQNLYKDKELQHIQTEDFHERLRALKK